MTRLAAAPQLRSRPLLDHPAVPAIASAMAALIVFAITLGGTFIYDDHYIILVDPRISHPRLWGQFWTKGYFAGGIDHLSRPLVSMSYAIQWQLSDDRPAAYHAVNWLLHAAVAAAVAEFVRRRATNAAALAAGLLFAVHPVHVEAVAQIVGRAELCCALGVIGALLLFARRPLTGGRVAAIFACQALAILSKEQGVLLPVLLLLFGLLLWRQPAGPPTPQERRHLGWLVVSLTWGLAIYLVTREHFLPFEWNRGFLDWGIQPMANSFGRDRVLMPIVLLGHYTRLLVFPSRLSLDYGANVIGSVVHLADPYLWIGIAAALAWLLCAAAAAWRQNRLALFCLLSLALLYGMIGNILTLIGVNLAERLMYLPSAFFLMAVALLLARLPRPWFALLLSILVLAGALRSFTYARQWNNRLEFYKSSLARQPNSSQLHMLLTVEYLDRHDLPAALQVVDRATDAFPNYNVVWAERGYVEEQAGLLQDAKRSLRRAFELSPSTGIGTLQQEVDQKLAALHHPATTRSAAAPQK